MTRLLDTNHAIAYLNGHAGVRARVEATRGREDDFAVTTTVLGELYYGAHASERVAENLAKLSAFRRQFLVLDFDAGAAEEFGRIRAEQRGKGRPVPAIDAQIAAIARLTSAALVTNDGHFDELDGLFLENWLEEPGSDVP